MNQERFETKYQKEWAELEGLLASLDGKPPTKCVRFPELYRRACHHLALVRERRYGADLERRLGQIVLRGHGHLYRHREAARQDMIEFALSGFPRLVRKEWRLVAISTALFVLPLFGILAAAQVAPDLVYSVLPPEVAGNVEEMYSEESEFGRTSDSDFLMFGFYVYNNVGIAFRTFAAGIVAGLGTVFFLVYNGLAIGAVIAVVAEAGYSIRLTSFGVGHGAFELTAIVLAGAAGLRLGAAVVAPGRRTRRAALELAAKGGVRIIYGAGGMLLLAAFVEAFWSSSGVTPSVKFTVGAFLWGLVAFYFGMFGRRDGP